MPPAERKGGVEVVGLRESINALNRWDKQFGKEAKGILKEQAITVRDSAWRKQPGGAFSRRGLTKTNIMGYSATAKGAAIKLKADSGPAPSDTRAGSGWALVMEFGENKSYIPVYKAPGKGVVRTKQRVSFTNRGARRHKPPTSRDLYKNTGGYMVLPALRQQLPIVDRIAATKLTALYVRAKRAQGLR